MAPLKNAKHEIFAQLMVFGDDAGNATRCYVKTFGTQNRQSAYKLSKRPDIVSRLADLRMQKEAKEEAATQSAIEKLGITQEWVLGTVKENVERAMQAKSVLDDDGKPIGEYKYDGAVANKGLELLGRHVGLFLSTGDTINNVLQIGVQLIDRPPDETYEQWIARRRRELTHKTIEHHTNGHAKNGNGQGH